jgi:nucleoside-diphosphate-sugar epimerase
MKTSTKPLSVGIIGCGWLGTALALSLLKTQAKVIATTTSATKQENLTRLGITTNLLTLPCAIKALNKLPIFKQQQLVICITPQLKYGKYDYAEKIANIAKAAEYNNVKHIILLSTTAVYRGLSGKIDETVNVNLDNEKVQCLIKAENELANFSGQTSIIRLAGLVGENRHPGNFLAGKTKLANAQAQVNVIHQQDAVGIIKTLLTLNETSTEQVNRRHSDEIYNAVSLTRASRQKFYQQAAKALALTPPEFNPNNVNTTDKMISAKKIQDKLNYQFVYPDLLAWLN